MSGRRPAPPRPDLQPAGTGRRRTRARSHPPRGLPLALLAAVLLVGTALNVYLNRRMSFYSDDWFFVFTYTWSPGDLVRPDNGHLPLLAHVSWNTVMRLFGIDSYLPFQLLGMLFVALMAGSLYWYGARRCSWQVGLALAVVLLSLGSAFHVLLWPLSGLGLVPLAALPISLLLLDRRTLATDVSVAGLVALALTAGGYGLLLPAALLVELLLRRDWRRLVVVLGPLVVFAAWMLAASPGTGAAGAPAGAALERAILIPTYTVQSLVAGAGSLAGQGAALASLAAAGYVALLVWLVRQNPAPDWVRILTLLSAAAAFAGLVRLAREGEAELGAPRYLAFLAVPLALILVEAARDVRPSRFALRLMAAGLVVAVVGNGAQLVQSTKNFGYLGDIHRAQLTAIELAGDAVDPAYQPPTEGMQRFSAGEYLEAARRHGEHGFTEQELAAAPEYARQAADAVLVEVGQAIAELRDVPACAGTPTQTVQIEDGNRLRLIAIGATEVRLRRFATADAAEPVLAVPAGSTAAIATRDDDSELPWQVTLSAPALVCAG